MIVTLLATMVMAPVTLHLSNAKGKPIANREVWIMPTNSTKGIRNFGWHWSIPRGSDAKKGKTDSAGNVKIDGVKKGVPMMVITIFGPRFDPIIRARAVAQDPEVAKYTESQSMDVIKFEGAVYAGKPANVVLADNYQITGRATDFETGAPVPNVTVVLKDTGFGHMGGYPGTDLEETKTDAQGRYTFRNLPNLYYEIEARKAGPSVGIESRPESGNWRVATIFNSKGEWQLSSDRGLLLDQPQRSFDFRISKTATLEIVVKKGTAKSFKGWTVSVDGTSGSGSGENLGWIDPNKPASESEKDKFIEQTLIPGTCTVIFLRESDSKQFQVAKLKLKSGSHQKLEFKISDIGR